MTVEVAITVDVEFTIGGAFDARGSAQPVGTESVECIVDGERRGVDFIADTLEASDLRGTFFVETLNTSFFGDEPMGAVARRLAARNHDVQMHAHPCWTVFEHADWRERVRRGAPCDSLALLADADVDDVVQRSLAAFARWGVPRPVAFRAGNLQADRRLYGCLKAHRVPLSSNVGLGVHRPDDAALRLAGGRHWIDGTLEVPVASYVDVRLPWVERWKTFTVVGTGGWEARQWLAHAARAQAGPVVILTHPAEYVRVSGEDWSKLQRNDVAIRRLRELCAFLADNRDRFDVVTFGGSVERWTLEPGTPDPSWHTSALARAARVVENRAAG